MPEPRADLLEREQPHERLLPAAARELELRDRPRRRRRGQRQPALGRQLQHLVDHAPALVRLAPQALQPCERAERQRAGVLGADVLGQADGLVGVRRRIGEAAVPDREVAAQPEHVGQEPERALLARQGHAAVERAPGAGAVADEGGAASRPQERARLVERIGPVERLGEERPCRLRLAAQEPPEAAHEQDRDRVEVVVGRRLELLDHVCGLEKAVGVAAHGRALGGEPEQAQPRVPVEREDRPRGGDARVEAACRLPRDDLHLHAEARRQRAGSRVVEQRLDPPQQAIHVVHAAREQRGVGRGEQAPGAVLRTELGRALERAHGGRVAGPSSRTLGGALELGRGLLVGRDGGGGAMPGVAVGVALADQHRGQRGVGGAALARRRAAVDRRAHERVAEAHPLAVGVEQPGTLGGVERAAGHAQACGGGEHAAEVLAVVGRGEQQQPPGVLGQRADASEEGLLDPRGERHVVLQRRQPRALVLGQPAGQLEQRQRVPVREPDQLVPHAVGEALVEQGGGDLVRKALDRQLGQAGGDEAPPFSLASRREQRHGIGLQPPGGEEQGVARTRGRASARRRPRTGAARRRPPR